MKKIIENTIFIIIYLIIMIMVIFNKLSFLDTYIYKIIYGLRNAFWDFIFINITKMGNITIILIIVIALLLKINRKNQEILSLTVILTVLSNQLIKLIVKRPRPNHIRLIRQAGYSFPSGHSMISIAVYGFLLYYIQKKYKKKYSKVIISTILVLLIIMIGISRVYVGVHYPSDIVGGYFLSIYILKMVIYFSRKNKGSLIKKVR